MWRYGILINSSTKDLEHDFQNSPKFDLNEGDNQKGFIQISENAINIEYEYNSKKYNFSKEIIYEKIYADAIEKAMIAFFIINGRRVSENNIIVYSKKDKEKYNEIKLNTIDFEYWNILYRTEDTTEVECIDCFESLSDEQKNTFIQNFLSIRFADETYEHLRASLYAYIFSLLKNTELEKFVYRWMSMNGLMNFLPKAINQFIKEDFHMYIKSPNVPTQMHGILKFINNNYSGKPIDREKRKSVSNDILKELYKLLENNIDLDYQNLKNSESSLWKVIRKKLDDNELTDSYPYEYVLMDLAYYFRNDIFHANNPIPLISSSKKRDSSYRKVDINVLALLNDTLEKFLSEWIPKFYNYSLEEIQNRTRPFYFDVYIKSFKFSGLTIKTKDENRIIVMKSDSDSVEIPLNQLNRNYSSETKIDTIKKYIKENIITIKNDYPKLFE